MDVITGFVVWPEQTASTLGSTGDEEYPPFPDMVDSGLMAGEVIFKCLGSSLSAPRRELLDQGFGLVFFENKLPMDLPPQDDGAEVAVYSPARCKAMAVAMRQLLSGDVKRELDSVWNPNWDYFENPKILIEHLEDIALSFERAAEKGRGFSMAFH